MSFQKNIQIQDGLCEYRYYKPQNEKSSWHCEYFLYLVSACMMPGPPSKKSVIYPGPPTILPYLSELAGKWHRHPEAPRLELVFKQLEDSQKNSTSQAFPKQRRAFAYHKLTHGLPIVATKQKSSVSYK